LTRHTAVRIIRAIPMPEVTKAIRSVQNFFIRATLSGQTSEAARVATPTSWESAMQRFFNRPSVKQQRSAQLQKWQQVAVKERARTRESGV
jgi:hypothetical protein